jgi:hypothetical protein
VIKEQHKTDSLRLSQVSNGVRITLREVISNMLVIQCRRNCFVKLYICEETCIVAEEANTCKFRLEVTAAGVRIFVMTSLGRWLCHGSDS